MQIFTSLILGPIEIFLQAAQARWAIAPNGCLIDLDTYDQEQAVANYSVLPAVSITPNQVTANSAITVEHSGTTNTNVDGVGSINHQIQVVCADQDPGRCRFTRDYCLAVLRQGLLDDAIGFLAHRWDGLYQIFSQGAVSAIGDPQLYVCRATLLISLSEVAVCEKKNYP